MTNMRNKILMTLALLLTAVTGAWAQTETPLVTIQASENSTFTSGSKTFNDIATVTITGNGYYDNTEWVNCTLTVTPADGVTITSVKFYGLSDGDVVEDTSSPFEAEITYDSNISRDVTKVNGTKAFDYGVKKIEVFGTAGPPLTVEWDPATKTGNFTMPAYDVEIAPIYAPVAQWAKVEDVDQLPTAIEGIYAESTDAIVTAGTVAKIGETENPQGTVMYAVTSTNQATAPALDAFSADVPTAEKITIGSEVLVWYYIKGADTPEGEDATAENTFNDSEICAEPIKVTVLSNKFDITFKAANDNTIETGKATVTVGGTAATVTDGKLEDVKMGTEVKVTAKEGYKFRKVEVKKAAPATTVTWNSSDFYFDANPYTKDGVTLTPSNDMAANGNNLYQFGDNTFTTTLGKFIKIEIEFESTTYTFDGWTKGTGGQYQPDTQTYPDWWENLIKLTWTGDAESVTIKGKDVFGIHSITFTIQ